MMKDRSQVALTVKNDLDEIDRIWAAIDTMLKPYCLTRRELFQVRLAVDELFTNIVSYAFTDNRAHDIDVLVCIEKKHLVVTIEDDGIEFNPLEFTPPDMTVPLSERSEGGLGIQFCRKMAVNLYYERRGGKNRVTVEKRIQPPGFFKKLFSCRRTHGNNRK